MPVFNAVQFLGRSIGSVRRQVIEDWELIVVDDGSTDGSADWISQHFDDPRIRLISQANGGVSTARNKAIGAARGNYIAFLDADDEWHPEFLSSMLETMRDDVILAYCGWENRGLPGARGQPFVPPDYEGPDKVSTLFACCGWPIHAALTRRHAILEAGSFDTRLTHAEDYALWMEVATKGRIVRVPKVLAVYHYHNGVQASGNRGESALQFFVAQTQFIERHPEFTDAAGRPNVLASMYETLRTRGFECYWDRDLKAARKIFRRLVISRRARLRDLVYMVPAFLPLEMHRWLVKALSQSARTVGG